MTAAPQHLDSTAAAKWGEVHSILLARGEALDAGTLDALSCYASAWSQWLSADAQVKALGMVVKSPAGFPVENPYLGIVKKAMVELHRWGKELGLVTRTARKKPAPPAPTVADLEAELHLLDLEEELRPPQAPARKRRNRKVSKVNPPSRNAS
jgi:P27 family predicted phage terminase small subunit